MDSQSHQPIRLNKFLAERLGVSRREADDLIAAGKIFVNQKTAALGARIGRLDKDSSGLILLTNDGDFTFQMTHPKFHKEKVYQVMLDRPLEPLHQQMISDYGVMLEDGPSKFIVLKNENVVSPQVGYTVLLSEGRNRQIRRTFAALGYKVTKLHRTGFGKYQLSGLKPGEYVIIKP